MKDTVCKCAHWYKEHGDCGCNSPGCECQKFCFDAKQNTPEAIALRGGSAFVCARCYKTSTQFGMEVETTNGVVQICEPCLTWVEV
jgi:hypothetical protein